MASHHRTRVLSLSLAAAAALTVSGCGGDAPGDSADAAGDPATASASASTGGEAPGDSGGPPAGEQGGGKTGGADADVTAPGTTLKIGERAVVPFEYLDRHGVVAITVNKIEKGDQAAFDGKYGDRADGVTPYYIRYTVEHVDGDLAATSPPRLTAVTADGGPTGVVVSGDLGDCEENRAPDSFTGAGATYETCTLQAARDGVPAAGAKYRETEGGYGTEPLVWMG